MDFTLALKKHFGYDQFRPLQEQIIADAVAGRDVFALMPTGGGKSLCFQLPALLRDGLTIPINSQCTLLGPYVVPHYDSGFTAVAAFPQSAAARALGISRNKLARLLKS